MRFLLPDLTDMIGDETESHEVDNVDADDDPFDLELKRDLRRIAKYLTRLLPR